MALRSWGLGRLALVTVAYWAVAVVGGVAWALHAAAAVATAYEAAHPGGGDYLTTSAVTWRPLTVALVLLGPPLLLAATWAGTRRR